MTSAARELLDLLTNGKPHRQVYRSINDIWFVTYGGGRVDASSVSELIEGRYINPAYSDCPTDMYHVGSTIDVARTTEERKKHRHAKDAPLIYVEDGATPKEDSKP